MVITANNPVMVVQFVKSQDGRDNPETGDPAMFIVPSTSNMVTTATFITPIYSGGNTPGADYTNFMTMVIQNGQQGNHQLLVTPDRSNSHNQLTEVKTIRTNEKMRKHTRFLFFLYFIHRAIHDS